MSGQNKYTRKDSMGFASDHVAQVKQLLAQETEVFVLMPAGAAVDIAASAMALTSSLKTNGKQVWLAAPGELTAQAQVLPLAAEVNDKIGNRNLVISLKVGSRDSIDKVSYNLAEDGSVFNLVIQPKKEQPPLKSEDVTFSYSGAEAGLVIMVGVNRWEDLGDFYESERKLFTEAKTVAIHRYTGSKFALQHLDDPRAGSLSELTYGLIKQLGYDCDARAATGLLMGIDAATSQLTAATVTPDTFEAMANLIRAGGVRKVMTQTPKEATVPAFGQPMGTRGQSTQVPQDWLQPKILKSSDTSKA